MGKLTLFSTRAAAIAASIASDVSEIRTSGYAAAGDNGHGSYLRVGSQPTHAGKIQSADGAWWELVATPVVRIEQFGGKGDAVRGVSTGTDNLAAFNGAKGFISAHYTAGDSYRSGAVIEYGFGPGDYYHSATLTLDRTITLRGPRETILNAGHAASLLVPSGVPGILVSPITAGPTPGGIGSRIENIRIQPTANASGAATASHGIDVQAICAIHDVTVAGFGGNGINIVADVTGGSNANLWSVDRVYLLNNRGHGLYVQGGDANAGIATAVNASANAGWGVWDAAFLGNTYIACHTAENGLGSYKNSDGNSRSVYLGCYAEGDQPNALINFPAMVLGGLLSNEGTALRLDADSISGFQMAARSGDASTFRLYLHQLANEYLALYADDINFSYAYRLNYDPTSGCISLTNDVGGASLRVTTGNNTLTAGRSAALARSQVLFPQSIFVGNQQSDLRQITNGSAAPTTGAHAQGDIVFNIAPSAGGKVGWVCVTAGTPGTWKPFGAIDA